MARKNTQEPAADANTTADATTPDTSTTTATDTPAREERTTDNPNVVKVPYKMAGAVPQSLVGRTIWTPEGKNIEGIGALVEDGKAEHIVKLAQGALDVNRQRVIRAAASSEDVAKILDGTAEGTAELSQDERIDRAVQHVQDVSDAYVYGSIVRGSGNGTAAKAKKFDAAKDRARAAAQSNPELLANLKAIFGDDFDVNA